MSNSDGLDWTARAADGAVRGLGLGFLWAVWHARQEVQRVPRIAAPAALAQLFGSSVLGFGALLCGYSGFFSLAEPHAGKLPAAGIAGASVGLVIGAYVWPAQSWQLIGWQTAGFSALCAACQLFTLPPPDMDGHRPRR